MRELELLFGFSFPLDSVIDVRVWRAKASGIAALALGDEPTTLNLILNDGTRLEAKSRGKGQEQLAIEQVTRALAHSRATAALEAISVGHTFAFGEVALRPDGILFGGKVTRWEDIAGYAVREGGLLWDDAQGNLAGEVRLASVPFADALVLAISRRLPGKDYARMAPGDGPHGGVFAVTARTRNPGTFKYQLHVLGLLVAIPLLVFVFAQARRAYLLSTYDDASPKPVPVTAATIEAKPTAAPSAKPVAKKKAH